jgi:hypothetical protein
MAPLAETIQRNGAPNLNFSSANVAKVTRNSTLVSANRVEE